MGNPRAMDFERQIATAAAMEALGAAIGARLQPGDAVCLRGPLGAGKSTLARGLIRSLTTPDEEVPSPTFTLVQLYATATFPLAHFDLYRLRSGKEAYELGLDEALDGGAALIEWPERLGDAPPPDRLDIVISLAGGYGRHVHVTGQGSWKERAPF
jgi:tRNA threonylcarbamoyladenosine biosynthesis protein TsaE